MRCMLSARYFVIALADPYSVLSAAWGGLGRARAASQRGLLLTIFLDPTP